MPDALYTAEGAPGDSWRILAMPFLEPEITERQAWYEVDGPCGTEWVPADLVSGSVPERDGTGAMEPLPANLAEYCENTQAWAIRSTMGFGARLSAPGYLDGTSWVVFDTLQEAEDYLAEETGDDADDDE